MFVRPRFHHRDHRPDSATRRAAAVAEALESRRLLAVYVSDRTLFVDGTPGADELTVRYSVYSGRVSAGVNGEGASFATSAVDRVRLRGFGGADRLHGRDGNALRPTTLEGGDGNDVFDFYESSGHGYTLLGGAGNDAVQFRAQYWDDENPGAAFRFDGGSGIDEISAIDLRVLDLRLHPNVENADVDRGTIYGNALDNVLYFDEDGGELFGLGGNDTLVGGDFGSLLDGGDGNDLIEADWIRELNPGTNTLRGGAGNDTLLGGGGYFDQGEHLDGGTGNDRLIGSPQRDTLLGGDGNDTLDGGLGADLLKGGAGTDTLDYSKRTAALRVGLGTNGGDGQSGENDTAWYDLENILGGSGSDWLNGTGSNNYLKGNGGNDTLLGNGGRDALFGDSGNDRLDGGSSNDYIEGGTGNDTLIGGSGADTLKGKDGDDWLYGRDGTRDTLDGGSGSDRAQRDPTDYVLSIATFIA